MEIKHVFTTVIATDILTLDNTALALHCKAAVDAHAKLPINDVVFRKNQSAFLELSDPVLLPLVSQVTDRLNAVYNTLGFKKNTRLKILRAWANTNNTYAIDAPHSHPISFFTGVYYVNGAGTTDHGNLNLISPVAALPHCIDKEMVETHNQFNSWEWETPPVTGGLVLFPSWILPNVSRNYLEEDRISIAFDAIIVTENFN